MRLGRLLALFVSVTASCFAVYYGQTRAEVLAELGKPVSAITRSGREVLMYPAGVRIELQEGKVTVVQGMAVQDGPGIAVTPPVDPATAPAEKAKEEEQPEPDEPRLTREEQKKQAEEEAKAEKEWQEENAKARAEMEKAIGDLENMHAQAQQPSEPQGFDVMEFLTQLGVGWVLTLIALKISCKYWGAEVFWSGLMTVAAVDVAAKAVIGFVLLKVLEMPMTFYADEAVGALLMIIVLQKVSINRSLQQAVTITLTTKVFSIVVGSLLFMVVLAGF